MELLVESYNNIAALSTFQRLEAGIKKNSHRMPTLQYLEIARIHGGMEISVIYSSIELASAKKKNLLKPFQNRNLISLTFGIQAGS